MINRKKFIDFVRKMSDDTNLKFYFNQLFTKIGLKTGSFISKLKLTKLHDVLKYSNYKKNYNSSWTMYDVLFEDYDTILLIQNEMEALVKGSGDSVNKLLPTNIKDALLSTFKNKYKFSVSKILIDSFESSTCEYCQMQLSYGVYSKRKKTFTAHIDHIIPKSSNYLFSFSRGNFLISCSSCNTVFKNINKKVIIDRENVCPPELFRLHLTDVGLIKVSTGKLSKNDFDIVVNKNSEHYLEYLFLEERVSCFKKFLADFIHVNMAISNEYKINIVLSVEDICKVENENLRKLLISQYEIMYDNQVGQLFKSVKTAIIRDLKNHTYIIRIK
ncbi:HNH endonuclease [Candidatus Izemoplasma sp. B36]|uniref:HNH endonuclease n=1 Tax=Candidatus Izemoplasma sp. B36 TaxID=3242468 RepID=UPI003558EA2C